MLRRTVQGCEKQMKRWRWRAPARALTVAGAVVVALMVIGLAMLPSAQALAWRAGVPVRFSLAAPVASSHTGMVGEAAELVAHDAPVASVGCGHAPPFTPGSSQVEALRSGGLTRVFILHIPRGYIATHAYPLVLAMHGMASSARVMERMTGFSTLADRVGLVVAYPQGVTGSNGHTGWSSGGPGHPTVNDALFISDTLNAIQKEVCVNPRRIYATGFSNGGGMTWVLSCRLAGRIAAFASVSGSYYAPKPACAPSRAVPYLEIHGTGDGVVPYTGRRSVGLYPVTTWLSAWVRRDGCDAHPAISRLNADATEMRWTGCHGGVAIVHIRIAGGHHVWPERTLPGGATSSIWTFLSAWSLPEQDPVSRLAPAHPKS